MEHTEQQDEYDWLVVRWSNFKGRPFPRGWGGVDADRSCLVMLDVDLAGLLSAYVERRGLRQNGIAAMRRLYDELLRVLPSLNGEASEYFSELEELAQPSQI